MDGRRGELFVRWSDFEDPSFEMNAEVRQRRRELSSASNNPFSRYSISAGGCRGSRVSAAISFFANSYSPSALLSACSFVLAAFRSGASIISSDTIFLITF